MPFAQPEEGEEIVDAKGAYALPGLVDIHFHGAMGKDFCDGSEEAIQTLADFEASKGVLAICPATMTFSEEILNNVMDAAAAHKNGEGGTLWASTWKAPSSARRRWVPRTRSTSTPPMLGMFRRLQERSGGLIKLVDVAPEGPGALDFIRVPRGSAHLHRPHLHQLRYRPRGL